MKIMRAVFGLGTVMCVAVLSVGCWTLPCDVKAEPKPVVAPIVVATAAPPPVAAPTVTRDDDCSPVVAKGGGQLHAALAIPSGKVKTSSVLLEKTTPSEVRVGQAYAYDIKVTSLTDCELLDVVVTDTLPPNFKVQQTTPKASGPVGNVLSWAIGTMAPGESKNMRVQGVVDAAGPLDTCTKVAYARQMCLTSIAAVQPELKLTLTAPDEVLLCDEIPMTLTVTNTGTGVARNVIVSETLPPGLMTLDNQREVTGNAGDLAAGASQQFAFVAKASKVGVYQSKATAKEQDGDLTAAASATTAVRQPVLTITKTAPRQQFVGRVVKYDITVKNTGDAAAEQVTVTDTLPGGAKFVKASDDAKYSSGRVIWQIPVLKVNETKTLQLVTQTSKITQARNVVTASAVCAEGVSAEALTEVVGVPAILLEVIDIEDPLEMGDQGIYEIKATNQGSLPDTNIVIKCTLEENMDYVSSSGPTEGVWSAAGRTLTFKPLISLAPKQYQTWRVMVEAKKPGDVRFHVDMTTDQLTRPVTETEATYLY